MATAAQRPKFQDITLAQVAHFDNVGKTGKGAPRHMLRASLWSAPVDTIRLNQKEWEASAIIIDMKSIERRLNKWLKDGSIDMAYASDMASSAESVTEPGFHVAPFVIKQAGTHFVPHTYALVRLVENRAVDGALVIDNEMMILNFANTYAGGGKMTLPVAAQARFDAVKDGFAADWATCWPDRFS